MKVMGITAEYNPFHNGHLYHLRESRKQIQPDYTVAVMSGDFTQRGEPALLNKWHRSRLAVEQGIDLVLELPFLYACNRAEIFARGAVDVLAGIGATHISFGSESGNLSDLQHLAEALLEETHALTELRAAEMKRGYSYAKSNQKAVRKLFGPKAEALILQPNNILALEYLKRLEYWRKQGIFLNPVTVARHGAGYHQENAESGFAGASAIRTLLCDCHAACENPRIRQYLPDSVWSVLQEQDWQTVMRSREDRLFQLLRAEIVRAEPEWLAGVYCLGEGLEYKLKKEIIAAKSLDELTAAMVSRRYPEAVIRRIFVYLLLGLRETDPPMQPYARVLAAGTKGRELLRMMKKQERTSIPVLTNVNKELPQYPGLERSLRYDILASDMYHLLVGEDLYQWSDKVVTASMTE